MESVKQKHFENQGEFIEKTMAKFMTNDTYFTDRFDKMKFIMNMITF